MWNQTNAVPYTDKLCAPSSLLQARTICLTVPYCMLAASQTHVRRWADYSHNNHMKQVLKAGFKSADAGPPVFGPATTETTVS